MKQLRIIAGIAISVILLASVVSSLFQPAPLEVARAYCTQKGNRAEDLALLGYRESGGVFGKSQTAEFQVKGSTPRKKLIITLRQPLYFLSWQVADFHEEFSDE